MLIDSICCLQSLLRIINLRKYNGHVQFVPAPGYEAYGEPINQTNCCSSNTMLYKDDQGDEANVRPCGYQGPSISLDGCEWRSIDGPFISVWINNVPWASEDIMPAPNAKVTFCCQYLFLSCGLSLHTWIMHNLH